MGTGATMYRIKVDLSDVDRGVYEQLDLRIARHPSETMRWLVARTIAYCLEHQEGIAFGGGISTRGDEPAVRVQSLDGRTLAWIEVGTPSAERLHKAAKTAPRVAVYTHDGIERLAREVRGKRVHRLEEIDVYDLPADLVDGLAGATERNAAWSLTRSGGTLFATAGSLDLSAPIAPARLAGE